MKKTDKDLLKIPIVTYEELDKLGNILHAADELAERKFWKEVYEKRGLKYKKRGGRNNAN